MIISRDLAIRTLYSVIDGKEDRVYIPPITEYTHRSVLRDPCVYQHDGKPSCIVGHFLARLGASVALLEQLDNFNGTGIGTEASLRILSEAQFEIESDVLELLEAVQYAQDNGQTWANSLAQGMQDRDSVHD